MTSTLALDCLACQVLRGDVPAPGGVIHEDAYWVLDHSTSPVLLPGFLILKPKRHVEQLAELTADEFHAFAEMLRLAASALTEVLHPAKIYTCSFGEGVKHVHFYVVPRSLDMPADGFEVIRCMFDERRWLASDEAAAKVSADLRDSIRRLRGLSQIPRHHSPRPTSPAEESGNNQNGTHHDQNAFNSEQTGAATRACEQESDAGER